MVSAPVFLHSHQNPVLAGCAYRKDWWERRVIKEFSDTEWRENFRMMRRALVKLSELMKDMMSPATDKMAVSAFT